MWIQTCDFILLSCFSLVRQPVKWFVPVFLEKLGYRLWRPGPVPLYPAWQPIEMLLAAQWKQVSPVYDRCLHYLQSWPVEELWTGVLGLDDSVW